MGLIDQVNQAAPAPAPAPEKSPVEAFSAPEAMDADSPEEDNLSDDERETYDAAINMVAEIIYVGDESNSAIMDQLDKGETSQSVADTTLFILDQVEGAFQGQVPEDLVIPIADEISSLLLDLLDESGKIELTEELIVKTKGVMMEELFDAYGLEEAAMESMLQGMTADDVGQMKAVFEQGAQ